MPKTKIYTFYTDTHKELYDRFVETFHSSGVADSFELVSKKFEQECSGNFMEAGWNNTMRKKVEYVLQSIDECLSGWFIHADCDIQFFADFFEDMKPRIENYDLVAQSDNGTICAGFFACRANERMQSVFKEVLDVMAQFGNDQFALNALKSRFSHQLLPNAYFTIGSVNGGKVWAGTEYFMPPKKTFLHHANYVIGPKKKIELMDIVATKVSDHQSQKSLMMKNVMEEIKSTVENPPEFLYVQNKVHLGSDYGGWRINLNAVKNGDTVLDLGLGEDISFSQDLASKRNVTIIGVDPTDKSHRYVESLSDSPLTLIKKAVARDGVSCTEMFRNKNPSHVSESINASHASVDDESYVVDCVSIKQLREQYPNISLIKMDIEGAEYDVIDECIGVPQLCIEFHHFCIDGVSIRETEKCIKKLLDNGYEILDKNGQGTEFTFILK